MIPEQVTLKLSVRALDAETRDLLEARIRSIAALQAQSYGATAQVDYRQITHPLVNDRAATELAIATIEVSRRSGRKCGQPRWASSTRSV